MKAIQTIYRGIKFRSRTEARWAAFFDAARIPYDYEPEGYDLNGEWYLPDFWLPRPGVWFEVKGTEPTERETRMASMLSRFSAYPTIIAVGPPNTYGNFGLRTFLNGEEGPSAAFTGGESNLFISSECQGLLLTVRGSVENLSGVPDPWLEPARTAAAHRFGVHEA